MAGLSFTIVLILSKSQCRLNFELIKAIEKINKLEASKLFLLK